MTRAIGTKTNSRLRIVRSKRLNHAAYLWALPLNQAFSGTLVGSGMKCSTCRPKPATHATIRFLCQDVRIGAGSLLSIQGKRPHSDIYMSRIRVSLSDREQQTAISEPDAFSSGVRTSSR